MYQDAVRGCLSNQFTSNISNPPSPLSQDGAPAFHLPLIWERGLAHLGHPASYLRGPLPVVLRWHLYCLGVLIPVLSKPGLNRAWGAGSPSSLCQDWFTVGLCPLLQPEGLRRWCEKNRPLESKMCVSERTVMNPEFCIFPSEKRTKIINLRYLCDCQ